MGPRVQALLGHCVVSLRKNINPSLVLVQPRKTRPFITERLLMERKESNQTNKHRFYCNISFIHFTERNGNLLLVTYYFSILLGIDV